MQKRDNEDLLISIVMPVYNAEKYLDRAIKCVVAQTYPHWELILVDDCSTDTSLAICNQWAYKDERIHVIHHDQNMGIARSRTDGILASGGGGTLDSWIMMILFIRRCMKYLSLLPQKSIQGLLYVIQCDCRIVWM